MTSKQILKRLVGLELTVLPKLKGKAEKELRELIWAACEVLAHKASIQSPELRKELALSKQRVAELETMLEEV